MASFPVYELLAQDIKNLGVDTVFGLMSDDICQLVATFDAIGLRFIGARQETNAVMMAAGYAAASGKMGVVCIGRGAAAANAVHGAASASRTGHPILLICGEAPILPGVTNRLGPDPKEFPASTIFKAMGLPTFVPTSPENARSALADAVREMSSGKAVALLLPTDIQTSTIFVSENDRRPAMSPPPAPQAAQRHAVAATVALLGESKRPLIVAGRGAHQAGARKAIENLADRIGALVVTSMKGKDFFRGNPFEIGILGSSSNSVGRDLIKQADCVIAFGAGLNFFTTSFGAALPSVPIIQIDSVRTNIGRYGRAELGVVGDARLVAEQLFSALPERTEKSFCAEEIREKIASFDLSQDFEPAHTAHALDPRILASELGRMLPENRHVVFDGGNCSANWIYIPVADPSYFTPTQDFGSIGLGVGAAVGVARARPDCTTALFIGDGGLLMSMGEIETVIRERLPMVIVVMNDAAFGAEVHLLEGLNFPSHTAKFNDVDFAPMAASLGFKAYTVRTMKELGKLAPVLARPEGPIFLDCKINGEVVAPFMLEVLSPPKP